MLLINVCSHRSGGKTWASLAIKKALENLGAIVIVRDEDTGPNTLKLRSEAIALGEKPLLDVSVIVRQVTFSKVDNSLWVDPHKKQRR